MDETTPAAPPLPQPRKLGDLLSTSLDLTFNGFWDYAAILLAGLAPGSVLVGAALVLTGFSDREGIKGALLSGQYLGVGAVLLAGLFAKLLDALATLAVIISLNARDRGEALGLGECYSRAAERLWSFLWTELLVGLWVIAGLICFIIPGIVMAIRYSLTQLVVVLDGRSGSEALGRSRAIIIPHMGKVFGNFLVVGILAGVIVFFVIIGLSLGVHFIPGHGGAVFEQAYAFIAKLAERLIGVWALALSVLLYKDLSALHPMPEPAPEP